MFEEEAVPVVAGVVSLGAVVVPVPVEDPVLAEVEEVISLVGRVAGGEAGVDVGGSDAGGVGVLD